MAGYAVDPHAAKSIVELTPAIKAFLPTLGFLGGLLSGFIGSGGAFVLTPGMMSVGVPGPTAVASNMCHKFPKALVGAMKRAKFGHVDVLLGLIMGFSAFLGVQVGIKVQKWILSVWGEAGSNLYISAVFVVVLLLVGSSVLRDAYRSKNREHSAEQQPAKTGVPFGERFKVPPMIYFKTAKIRASFWLTIPLGFATGMLAATIAVGGFIGVPAMIYILGASAFVGSGTELVIAFVMGLTGTFAWALHGFADIRLAFLILLGSLFGVQLGAIGTSYVKDYMIKLVMAAVMLIVMVSRLLNIPVYLHELDKLVLASSTIKVLESSSFLIMCGALLTAGVIILGAIAKGIRADKTATVGAPARVSR
ncbi:MAG: sulfite exporter TauE/SafE family protein [Bacillota bacterium]